MTPLTSYRAPSLRLVRMFKWLTVTDLHTVKENFDSKADLPPNESVRMGR